MIKIEELNELTPGMEQLLFPYSADEFLRAGNKVDLLRQRSEEAVAIYAKDELLCYAGIYRPTFVSRPLLWLLLGRTINRWSSRLFKKLTADFISKYPDGWVSIEDGFAPGARMAGLCGFCPTEDGYLVNDKFFRFYEVR